MNLVELRKEMNLLDYDQSYINMCLSYAENLKRKNLPIIFDVEHLCKLIGIKENEFYKIYKAIDYQYHKISIPKKSGGERVLSVPAEKLKMVQRWILDNILYRVNCKDNVTGFIPNKSIVDNAKKHINKPCVIGIDIENFFPTIHFGRVKALFKYLGYNTHLSIVFANLCTYNKKLPQGAPTSPYIANLICNKMDSRINSLCIKHKAIYTRYADDITISGDCNINKLIPIINSIIKDEGFNANKKKERVLYQYHSQKVTGITVNKKLSAPKKTERYLRQNIYYIKKFGLKDHLIRTKNYNKSNYKQHLYGIAYFIKMIDKEKGKLYLKELSEIEWEVWD